MNFYIISKLKIGKYFTVIKKMLYSEDNMITMAINHLGKKKYNLETVPKIVVGL